MASDSIPSLTQDNFDSEVSGTSVPVIVDFWAEWCGPCKMLSPLLDEIAAEKGDALKICKVNLETDTNQELAAKYSVSSIPALLFFKDGELKDQMVGVQPKDVIIAKAESIA